MTAMHFGEPNIERQILENVHTLMLRAKISGRALGEAVGIPRGTMSRRLTGENSFLYMEVRALARYFLVTFEEVEGALPSYDEWSARWNDKSRYLLGDSGPYPYAIRDSNPEPADSKHRAVLTLVRGVKATLTPEPRAGHLRAVAS